LTPIVKKDLTLPPKIIAMKFFPTPRAQYGPNEDINHIEEQMRFVLVIDDKEARERSPAKEYRVDIEDLDTGEVKTFYQHPDLPFSVWQNLMENIVARESTIESEETVEPINGRITIWGENEMGTGKGSSFLMPFKNMYYGYYYDERPILTTSILKKYWSLYSETPLARINFPKTMHIYYDIDLATVENDRERLSNNEWRYTSLGDWKLTNQQQFRWVFNEDGEFKLSYDGWKPMTADETKFILKITESFMPTYRNHIATNLIDTTMAHVFKYLVRHPFDPYDSIVIYFMRGGAWQF